MWFITRSYRTCLYFYQLFLMPNFATRWLMKTICTDTLKPLTRWSIDRCTVFIISLPALAHHALWAAVSAQGAVSRLGHAVAASLSLALPGPGQPGHRVVIPVVRRQGRPGVLGVVRARSRVKVRVGGHRCTDSHCRKWRDTISGGPGRDRIGSVMCSRLENGREWC